MACLHRLKFWDPLMESWERGTRCLENLHQWPVFTALGQSGEQLFMVNSSRRNLVLEICNRVSYPKLHAFTAFSRIAFITDF